MRTATELLQTYIHSSAQEAAALFAADGALELPYLEDFGIEPRYEGPEKIGTFLTFLYEKKYRDAKLVDEKIYIDTFDQAFGEYTIRLKSRISGKDEHKRLFGHCTAVDGKIVLLREAPNVLAAAHGTFACGLSGVVNRQRL